MSLPERDERSDVVSMEEALRQMYDELLSVDQQVHRMRDLLKARIYALHAADDEDVVRRARDVEARLASGDVDAMEAAQFVTRSRELSERR